MSNERMIEVQVSCVHATVDDRQVGLMTWCCVHLSKDNIFGLAEIKLEEELIISDIVASCINYQKSTSNSKHPVRKRIKQLSYQIET